MAKDPKLNSSAQGEGTPHQHPHLRAWSSPVPSSAVPSCRLNVFAVVSVSGGVGGISIPFKQKDFSGALVYFNSTFLVFAWTKQKLWKIRYIELELHFFLFCLGGISFLAGLQACVRQLFYNKNILLQSWVDRMTDCHLRGPLFWLLICFLMCLQSEIHFSPKLNSYVLEEKTPSPHSWTMRCFSFPPWLIFIVL